MSSELLTMSGSNQGGVNLPWPLMIAEFIERMSPLFSHLDTATEEEIKARIQPNLDKFIENLAKEGKAPRMYLNVAGRILWFKKDHPKGTSFSFVYEMDREREYTRLVVNPKRPQEPPKEEKVYGYAHYAAVVFDGSGVVGYGEKTETALGFDDYVEKAATGAIGRALLTMGYGTQFEDGMRELNEGKRIVDSPIPANSSNVSSDIADKSAAEKEEAAAVATANAIVNKATNASQTRPGAAAAAAAMKQADSITSTQVATETAPKEASVDEEVLPGTIAEMKVKLQDLNKGLGPFGFRAMIAERNTTMTLPNRLALWTIDNYQNAYRFTYKWSSKLNDWCGKPPTAEMLQALADGTAHYKAQPISDYAKKMFDQPDIAKLDMHQVNALLIEWSAPKPDAKPDTKKIA